MRNENENILKLAETEELAKKFLHISYYTLLDNVPEIILEWWSNTGKDARTFLQDEGFSKIMNEQVFTDILLGKYQLNTSFLSLIKEKIPYNVSLEKLYTLNKKFCLEHPEAEKLPISNAKILALLETIYKQKKAKREDYIQNWHKDNKDKALAAVKRYRLLHPERVKAIKRKYRETHKEQIKEYKQSRREIINKQQRQRYHADIEEKRRKNRLYHREFSARHREELRERDKAYRNKKRFKTKTGKVIMSLLATLVARKTTQK